MDPVTDARRRGAQTRRRRTRDALIRAARARFADLGWRDTRMEDIASDAGVGVATAFTHFTKQSLLGHAYAPLVAGLLDRARSDIAGGRDPVTALSRHVHDLARLGRSEHHLTRAVLVCVLDQALTAGGPPDPGDENDIRIIVPMPAPMIELITYGQRAGTFRPGLPAREVGSYHTNAMLLQLTVTRPHEPAGEVAAMVLDQLLPALCVGPD